MIKLPRRVYSTPQLKANWPNIVAEWKSLIDKHNAQALVDGENPEDYPDRAVAFESPNFGWILSAPDVNGKRHVLVKY